MGVDVSSVDPEGIARGFGWGTTTVHSPDELVTALRAALDAGKPEDAAAALKAAQPVIDSMVNKGIIHKNAAARYKSRLAAGAKKAAAAK